MGGQRRSQMVPNHTMYGRRPLFVASWRFCHLTWDVVPMGHQTICLFSILVCTAGGARKRSAWPALHALNSELRSSVKLGAPLRMRQYHAILHWTCSHGGLYDIISSS